MFLFISKVIEKDYKNGFNKEQAIMLAQVCSTVSLTLEEPTDVLTFDIINEPETIVQEILEQIDL